ncbi:MAG: hypothetical protein K8W52_13990 [Deltaproteobacteria bacterium]|nr:hypothetical protein [Deltaproteobacteria bacterium]
MKAARDLIVLATAGALLAGSRWLRAEANEARAGWPAEESAPYAPSPGAVPFVSLGYRELAADLLWVRMLGYLGGHSDTAEGIHGLVVAAAAADPNFPEVYTIGARAMRVADKGVDATTLEEAAEFVQSGMAAHPDDYALPELAGEIYVADLDSKDPAQKRVWQEKGAALLEKALRMPGATAEDATLVAALRSKLGQHERAVRELREMMLVSKDAASRRDMLEKLAELEQRDASAVELEIKTAREAFETAWQRDRPDVPEGMYVLLGPPRKPYIDFADLASDRDLISAGDEEVLEPLDDGSTPAGTTAPGAASPPTKSPAAPTNTPAAPTADPAAPAPAAAPPATR